MGQASDDVRLLLSELADGTVASRSSAVWAAGWRSELFGCRLTVLVAGRSVDEATEAALRDGVGELRPTVVRAARAPFSRGLGLAVVSCSAAPREVVQSLPRLQVSGRAFVSPVLIDRAKRTVHIPAIGRRGGGFDPARQDLLRFHHGWVLHTVF